MLGEHCLHSRLISKRLYIIKSHSKSLLISDAEQERRFEYGLWRGATLHLFSGDAHKDDTTSGKPII